MIIKKVSVVSAALNSAVIAALLGLVIAILFLAFGSLFTGALQMAAQESGESNPAASMMGAGIGIASLIIFPILYAVFGFIGGALYAFIFNIASRLTGGLKIEAA